MLVLTQSRMHIFDYMPTMCYTVASFHLIFMLLVIPYLVGIHDSSLMISRSSVSYVVASVSGTR